MWSEKSLQNHFEKVSVCVGIVYDGPLLNHTLQFNFSFVILFKVSTDRSFFSVSYPPALDAFILIKVSHKQ